MAALSPGVAAGPASSHETSVETAEVLETSKLCLAPTVSQLYSRPGHAPPPKSGGKRIFIVTGSSQAAVSNSGAQFSFATAAILKEVSVNPRILELSRAANANT